MYKSCSGRKVLYFIGLFALLTLFLFALRLRRTHDGLENAYSSVFEHPVEFFLVEDDVSHAGSEAAHNDTLGFQRILALSARPSWRTRGLSRISELTGVRIDVIEPARPEPETIEDFLALGPEKAVKPDIGSTLAWLGHLAILRKIVASGIETVLITEDDVDFDVGIKLQMLRLANAVQHFSNTSQGSSPYGTAWEVLWLGHCGETWNPAKSALQYPDSSRISHDRYIGWKESAFAVIQDNHRLVQWASGPTCTYAYAVTLTGARKILDLANKGRSTAFDTELSDLCVFGKLKCITVTPQLFAQYVPDTRDGQYASEIERENKHGARPGDDSHVDLVMGSTQNIVQSARCMALFGKSCLPTAEIESSSLPNVPRKGGT